MEAKVLQQIDTVLPANLRELARNTLAACKDIRKYIFAFHFILLYVRIATNVFILK